MTKLKSIELLLQDRKLDHKSLNQVKGGFMSLADAIGSAGAGIPPPGSSGDD
ncbi:MAG: hypothetical protein AAF573_15915 [Bacteroidota bacterium]